MAGTDPTGRRWEAAGHPRARAAPGPGPAAPGGRADGGFSAPAHPRAGAGAGARKKEGRPAVTVYNSPVLPSEPSSRCPVQPLRAEPSSLTEPVVLRQPTPQPLRAGPSSLTAREWEPCGPLVSDRLESFPSLAGFLTGRRGNISRPLHSPQYGTFVYKHPLVFLHSDATRWRSSRNGTCKDP